MDIEAATIATEAFINAMRRQWLKLKGQGDCPVRNLFDYPLPQRNALIAAITSAIAASSADNIQKIKEKNQ